MRFFRNLFRSDPPQPPEDNALSTPEQPERTTRAVAAAPGETVVDEYTDGSQSYSYSETEEDARPLPTPKSSNVTLPVVNRAIANSSQQQELLSVRATVAPPMSATAIAPEIDPERTPRRLRVNGSASSAPAPVLSGDEGSESSHYRLRGRRSRSRIPPLSNTMSTGSFTERDMKPATTKRLKPESSKPADPLAISAMPHATSARTTSGVLGNPGKVSVADVNRATLSTLRYLCGELGILATGSKLEVKERVMNKIKSEPYDGEEVQLLSPPDNKNERSDITRAAQSTPVPASSARGDTITTGTARGTPGRGERVGPSSGTLGDRRRNSVQANAGEIVGMMRRSTGQPSKRAPESPCQDRPSMSATPATDTHIDGVRLAPANRSSRRVVDVPPGIDRMSPAGRNLPPIFAGARGGPPNPTVSANELSITSPRSTCQRDTPAAAAIDERTTKTKATPRVSEAPAATLAPLKPIPKRGSMNGFVTPGDIVRTFNRFAPRRPPPSSTTEPGSSTPQKPPSLFRQGSRPSSERFPKNNINRLRSSAFGVPLSPNAKQVNKRQSLRAFPLLNSQPSPISGGFNRKRHSTGMHYAPLDSDPGIVNDLRSGLKARESRKITSLNDIRARESWRQNDRAEHMSSSAKKILAAIRKTAEENRVLCKGRKPLIPLGAPPSLKRARDEEDVQQPVGKRSRTGSLSSKPNRSSTPLTKISTPAKSDRGLSPRVPFGKRASLTPRTSTPIPLPRETDSRSTPQTGEKRVRSSLARESAAGSIDRKRRLGPFQPDVKKRASKRRSLSSVAFDAVKDDLNAQLKERDREESKKPKIKRGVTFAEPVDTAKSSISEQGAAVSTSKEPTETSASAPKRFELDRSLFPTKEPEKKEFSFKVRKTDESTLPGKKDSEKPSNTAIETPPVTPAVAVLAPPSDVTAPSVTVTNEATKSAGTVETKVPTSLSEPAKSQTTVAFGQPAVCSTEIPESTPSVSAPSATSPGPAQIVPTVTPENNEPKTPSRPNVPEASTEVPDRAEPEKPSSFTPKINPLTGGPSYASTPAQPAVTTVSAFASSSAASSSVTFGASGSFGSAPTSSSVFGTPSVAVGASSSGALFPSSASEPSSAPSSSTARKLPFGTNAPSNAAVFGSQGNVPASSAAFVSSSAGPSTVSFGAPSNASTVTFGMSSAATTQPAGFAASSAGNSASAFGTSSGPSFGFSAPSFATNPSPFGASSSAFSTPVSSNAFGASASNPFGASTSQSDATKVQDSFLNAEKTFGNSSGGFGTTTTTPFGASSSAQQPTSFPSFGASSQPSGNPFDGFGTYAPPANTSGNPFGNFSTSFNPSGPAATTPFDFGATLAAAGSNQGGASAPFGGSAVNAFSANGGHSGFGANNSNSFGNAGGPGSGSNPFGGSTGSNPFGQATPSSFGGAQSQVNSGGFGGASGGFGQASGGFGMQQQSRGTFSAFGQSGSSGGQNVFGQQTQGQGGLSSEARNLFGGASQPSGGHFTMGGSDSRPPGQRQGRRILRARRSRR